MPTSGLLLPVCVGHEPVKQLARLSAGDAVTRAEGAVSVAVQQAMRIGRFHVSVEGRASRHIPEAGLRRTRRFPPGRHYHDLGDLAPGDVTARLERAVGIAIHD